MKTFVEQAEKNGVELFNTGSCQFCGAALSKGVFECFNIYSHALGLVDLGDPKYHTPRFLSVDAHALQHPEVHGRWNNHLHLTRLHLIIDRKFRWDYQKTPMLSSVLNKYKEGKENEYIKPPIVGMRGHVNVAHLKGINSAEELVAIIDKWALNTYTSYSYYHNLVSVIADKFLKAVG